MRSRSFLDSIDTYWRGKRLATEANYIGGGEASSRFDQALLAMLAAGLPRAYEPDGSTFHSPFVWPMLSTAITRSAPGYRANANFASPSTSSHGAWIFMGSPRLTSGGTAPARKTIIE